MPPSSLGRGALMVDFRYHVVSIVAVFLALGIGIVFGTTVIDRAILNDLDRNVARLTDEKRALDTARRDLAERAEDAEAWGKAVSPSLVSGALAGERVVVVSAPGAPRSVRDDLVKQLGVAGATVTGRIRLSDDLVDPRRRTELDDLVLRELPQGFTLPGTGATTPERAMAELAYVLGTESQGPAPPASLTRVLAAFRERGFLAVDGDTVMPARNVVVLLPGAPASPSPSPSPTASGEPGVPVAVSLVSSLSRLTPRPGVVAVSPNGGSVTGTELEDIRADSDLKELVSTVDDVDIVFGQTALVLALDEARRGGHGHYGNGVGADAPLPTPTPTS